jgi:hypothetical protein
MLIKQKHAHHKTLNTREFTPRNQQRRGKQANDGEWRFPGKQNARANDTNQRRRAPTSFDCRQRSTSGACNHEDQPTKHHLVLCRVWMCVLRECMKRSARCFWPVCLLTDGAHSSCLRSTKHENPLTKDTIGTHTYTHTHTHTHTHTDIMHIDHTHTHTHTHRSYKTYNNRTKQSNTNNHLFRMIDGNALTPLLPPPVAAVLPPECGWDWPKGASPKISVPGVLPSWPSASACSLEMA